MNWKESKNIESNKYDLPGNWVKIEYFEALNILFRIENSLRVFVYIILKNEYQEKWKELSVTSDDEENSTINAIAKKRLTQDKNYAYLGYVINSPIFHLTSGELIRIIFSEAYWKLFKNYFLGSKEIIRNKLDEIGNVRNSLAHFRPIKKGDIELIKQNSIHTLTEIEKTIREFILCPDIVPTNTTEKWYKDLNSLNCDECVINFRQCNKGEWVKIILSFTCPIFRTDKFYYYELKTINIKTDYVLINYPILSKYVICITETLPSSFTKNPESIELTKKINLTFSKKSLGKDYSKIKPELKKIITQISKEIILINEDNLARGKLVELVRSRFIKGDKSEYYTLANDVFETELNEESPVEFWGTLNYADRSFITDTEKYPWMPIEISEDKGMPF